MARARVIVTIHQPEHLPWLGLFHKVRRADRFVVLDSVPFRKNYFQNRNRILGADGPCWVTVPVLHHGVDKRLDQIRTNETVRWRAKYLRTVEQHYRNHPGFARHFAWLEAILAGDAQRLVEINLAFFDVMAGHLGVYTPRTLASTLPARGAKSDLILDLCRHLGASRYLAGPSGRDYLDQAAFAAAGVEITFHEFRHPTYSQRLSSGGAGLGRHEDCLRNPRAGLRADVARFPRTPYRAELVPNLSALDALMNLDLDAARLLDDDAATLAVKPTEAAHAEGIED